ncbi:MAG: LicD family protein [Clostridium sp.]
MYYKCNLKDGQALMLEVLKYVDKVCNENNIEYSLACGTLLGAYRHGGFIPWDDDIDILMTRESHKRFIEVMKTKNDGFYVMDKSLTPGYAFEFSKVMMEDTMCGVGDDGTTIKMHRGVFIDIFICDFYTKNLSKRYRKLARQFENARKDIVINNLQSNKLKLVFKTFKFISKIFVPFNIVSRVRRKYEREDGRYFGYGIEQADELFVSREDYFPLSKISFCGEEFSCPKNVEKILECEYGSTYMELPPEEKRLTHVDYISIKKNVAEKYNISIDENNVVEV